MLLGREQELRAIADALAAARSGVSATVALVGEAGIGKTVLVEHAAELAADTRVLRARGIESEAQVPFASLLELLRPALGMIDQVPRPQATALEGALALRPGLAQERFAIGAATLSLLAAYAEHGPVTVLIDDAQWLDGSSAQALLFAIRRLVADPIAVVLAAREGEPSLLDGSDLPTVRLTGLSTEQAATLLGGLRPVAARRLRDATAGNPLAMLELAADASEAALAGELVLAPDGAPLLVPARVASTFLRRAAQLDGSARRALLLAATSDSGQLTLLARAATEMGIDLRALTDAEGAGLVAIGAGSVEFRHPLVRSAIYADASAAARREAHRALADSLPDRDVDRRAWHLAAAAVGLDDAASSAMEQAGDRARARSAYDAATAAYERAARLAAADARRGRLLYQAADAAWLAGLGGRAETVLRESRAATTDPGGLLAIDGLAGRIATRTGPIMRGHSILIAAAARAGPEHAVEMLAEATIACFFAGETGELLSLAEQLQAFRPRVGSARARFLTASAIGIARVLGGDAAAGAEALHEATALAEATPELRDDLQLLPWLAFAPLFLREASVGRSLLEHALRAARERAAVGALPLVLGLIARDHATTDRWTLAETTYREAIDLARESDQQTALVFGLSGFAWLQARRGRERECRATAAEGLSLSPGLGARMHEIWATAALGELELGLGDATRAIEQFERQRLLMADLEITDADLSPAAELVEAYLRVGRADDANRFAAELAAAAEAKGQPWSLARAHRCQGLLVPDDAFTGCFERALAEHARTPDVFETARTLLAYGQRLRRARHRVLARDQLRAAIETFEQLGARPWTDRARAELAATGVTLRRRDPTTIDELTAQELQISVLLAGGKTTREAAATLFLSPKTIEYHLRHVYQKLEIHSREELAAALMARPG